MLLKPNQLKKNYLQSKTINTTTWTHNRVITIGMHVCYNRLLSKSVLYTTPVKVMTLSIFIPTLFETSLPVISLLW